jgi:SAM-dependent methyltransferase
MNDVNDRTREYWEERFSHGVSLGTVGWLGLGESFNAWMYRVRKANFIRLVRPFVSADARVLDIGSGTGFYLDLWRELGVKSVTGSDLTTAAREALRRKFDVPIIELDIGASHLSLQERYDAISAMDVLFHIVDDERYSTAFHNIASLLVPGGIFVFTDNLLHHHDLRGAHQVNRTIDVTMDALHDAGFTVLLRRPVFALMNTPVDTQSRFMRRYWSLLRRIARSGDRVAGAAGSLLYVPELLVTRVLREGPSTELVVCRSSGPQRHDSLTT